MTQEEIENFLSNTKVYVDGKSREIQNKLFSFGYKWNGGCENVQHENEPFLMIYHDKTFGFSKDMIQFKNNAHREISADEILSLELTKPTYRPFRFREECWNEALKHSPFGWLTRKDTGEHVSFDIVTDESIIFDGVEFLYETAMNFYIFADREPFGIKNE